MTVCHVLSDIANRIKQVFIQQRRRCTTPLLAVCCLGLPGPHRWARSGCTSALLRSRMITRSPAGCMCQCCSLCWSQYNSAWIAREYRQISSQAGQVRAGRCFSPPATSHGPARIHRLLYGSAQLLLRTRLYAKRSKEASYALGVSLRAGLLCMRAALQLQHSQQKRPTSPCKSWSLTNRLVLALCRRLAVPRPCAYQGREAPSP